MGELVSKEMDNILEDDTQGSHSPPHKHAFCMAVSLSMSISLCLSLIHIHAHFQLHACTPIHIYVFKK